MKKSISLVSTLALAVALPAVLHSNKALSAEPIQAKALQDATRLPLGAGTVIKKGMKLPSPSGDNNLVLGGDGNLMVTDKSGNRYSWGLAQVIKLDQVRIDRIEFRADGSLVGVNDKGAVVWTAPVTRRDPAATLTITDGGTLQLATSNEVLWASNDSVGPIIRVFTDRASMKATTPDSGWYAAVELTDPQIKINYTIGVSPSAVNAVANIYTEMMKRLKPTRTAPNPKRKFDGFKVFLTNEEPWELVKKLPGVGNMHPDPPAGTIITKDTPTAQRGGEILLGGGGEKTLWICEQLICKKGVKTPERRGIVDDSYRTFDQVIHEMAHSIDFQLVDDPILNQFNGAGTPVESFAWRVQDWFGVPGRGKIPADQETLLNTVFTSRALFSPEGYRPIPAEASAPATRLPINPGTVMKKGMKLPSRSGNHTLVVGTDGNLVVMTKDNKYVWGLDQVIRNLPQVGLNQAEFRRDGSLGAYDGKGLTKWIAPNTTFDHQAQLDVTDEGVLQIANTKEVLWASNGVVGAKLQPATGFPIRVGAVLPKGMKLPSRSGNHTLVVGTDGNLVVTRKDGGYLWGLDKLIPNLSRVGLNQVEFRPDGSLGSYNVQREQKWVADLITKPDPLSVLNLTDEGVLQIVNAKNEILWSSLGVATELPAKAGALLKKGLKLPSPSGKHLLVFQAGDGNLMVTDKSGKGYIWGLDQVIRNLGQVGVDHIGFTTDGRFGAYDDKGAVLWQAPLKRLDPKAQLTISDQGVLQILSASGEVLWASNGVVGTTNPTPSANSPQAACPAAGSWTMKLAGTTWEGSMKLEANGTGEIKWQDRGTECSQETVTTTFDPVSRILTIKVTAHLVGAPARREGSRLVDNTPMYTAQLSPDGRSLVRGSRRTYEARAFSATKL